MKSVIISAAVLLAIVAVVYGNSNGGSEACCVDMVPLHDVSPQGSPFASSGYKVAVDKHELHDNEQLKITITGERPFKGYLLQVRDGDKAVGTFQIAGNDAHSKTINCFSKQKNMATHNNAGEKKSLTVSWKPPTGEKKAYTVYVTVAENGGVFWTKVPTAKITVH